MKKVIEALKLAFKATGITLTDDEIQALDAVENEDQIIPFTDKLINEIPAFGTKMKEAGVAAGRKEIFDGVDSKLTEKFDVLKGIIGEEKFNKIKGTQGVAKLGILADDMAEAIAEARKAQAGGNQGNIQAANDKIRELTEKMQKLETDSQKALADKEAELTGKYEGMFTEEALFTTIAALPDIAKEYARPEIIRGVLVPSVLGLAKTKGVQLKRDGRNFEVMRQDGTPFIENNKTISINDLVVQATRDYAKKSDAPNDPPPMPGGSGHHVVNPASNWNAQANGLS